MAEKTRLDSYVFENGFAESREKAKAYIMAGQVYVNGVKSLKAGLFIKDGDVVEVRGDKLPFVSRGGLKLQKAFESFSFSVDGYICMDVGASTGGFTDCMLQHNAKKVYSIDVGYGQLSWKLRTDERVVNLERTNFRYVTEKEIPEEIDFSSIDVSFISLEKILPVLYQRLKNDGKAVCLIKPQFEAGRENIGKKGVVRDPAVHKDVIEKVFQMALNNDFSILGLDFSPVKGPEGNIEYLMYIIKDGKKTVEKNIDIQKIIEDSHNSLDKGE